MLEKQLIPVLILLSCLYIQQTWAQCANAPSAALKKVCEQLHTWDAGARASPPKATVDLPPGIEQGQFGFEIPVTAQKAYDCMTVGCLCGYIGGQGNDDTNVCTLNSGYSMRKSVRKEYRQLTDEERQRYHAAILKIKAKGNDQYSFDAMAKIHSDFAVSGAAHAGPAFLPWHREYIKRYEIALRMVDPTISLPYWDGAIDSRIPVPKDSVLWTDELMGSTDAAGNVVGGAFANWRTIQNHPKLQRKVGASDSGPISDDKIGILLQGNLTMFLGYPAPKQGCPIPLNFDIMEYIHGNGHMFVGGDMNEQVTAGNDPVFYMHHCFVDLIWEMWRQQKQTRDDREKLFSMFPDNVACASVYHFSGADMNPFGPWKNIDGLTNRYTDNMYEYAPRPTCSAANRDCGSKYLFCLTSNGPPRCAAKIKLDGSCKGLSEADKPCFNGMCEAQVCIPDPDTFPSVEPEVTTAPTQPPELLRTTTPANLEESCFNGHECCSFWAKEGECQKNKEYMSQYCEASCGVCQPRYNLNDPCKDRHLKCGSWAKEGWCAKRASYMNENCRQSCNMCSQPKTCSMGRKAVTPAGGGGRVIAPQPVTTAPSWINKCTSPGCYNENMCCPYWSMQGECGRNPIWMQCWCRVSCGKCAPNTYAYGTCSDYDAVKCPGWARIGECDKNPWMLENCRRSCGTCLGFEELKSACLTNRGSQRPRSSFGPARGKRSSSFKATFHELVNNL